MITLIFTIIAMVKAYKKAGLRGWEWLVPVWGTWKLYQRVSSTRGKALAALVVGAAYGIMFGWMYGDSLARGTVTTSTYGGGASFEAVGADVNPVLGAIVALLAVAALVLSVMVCLDFARSFGRGVGTALLLALLPPIGWMVLGFGSSNLYIGPNGNPALSQEPWRGMAGWQPTAYAMAMGASNGYGAYPQQGYGSYMQQGGYQQPYGQQGGYPRQW